MKKIRLSRELSYILGLLIMTFSIALMTKADFGLSMIAAPTYIISQKLGFITYGQTEYIVQLLVLVLMCIVVGKFKIIYLTSFITSLIYGSALDFFIFLLRDFNPEQIVVRVILFVGGMVLTSISVAFFFHTYLPPCSYDYFVRTVVVEKKYDMRKTKIIFDATFLIIAVALSLILFKGFIGVSLGTVVIVIFNGNIITFFSRFMDRHIEFFDRFKISTYFK